MAVIGDFITVAGFSFSELEDQLSEAKDKVANCRTADHSAVQWSVCVNVKEVFAESSNVHVGGFDASSASRPHCQTFVSDRWG